MPKPSPCLRPILINATPAARQNSLGPVTALLLALGPIDLILTQPKGSAKWHCQRILYSLILRCSEIREMPSTFAERDTLP